MEALSFPELLFFAFVIIVSYSIRGGSGFGGVTVPLLALIMPVKILVPVVTVLGLFSSWSIVARERRHVAWSPMKRIAPWALGGALAGLYLFSALDSGAIARGLGVLVILYGLYSFWTTYRVAGDIRAPMAVVTPMAGTVAGFVGTLFGSMAGMFFAIYLDLQRIAKDEFRATAAAILFGLGVVRCIGYAAVGAFDRDALLACAAALPLMAIGVYIGNHLHANLNPLQFRRFVALVLLASGVPLLLR
ncbi:MAG: sulfite exporter TauE/SafE family protein [Rhodospirillaceae bacterium]